jgi:hypothetical protein
MFKKSFTTGDTKLILFARENATHKIKLIIFEYFITTLKCKFSKNEHFGTAAHPQFREISGGRQAGLAKF